MSKLLFITVSILIGFHLISCKQANQNDKSNNLIVNKNYDFEANNKLTRSEIHDGIADIFKRYNSNAKVLNYSGKLKNLIAVKKDNKYGIVDIYNNLVVGFDYDELLYSPKSIVLNNSNTYLFYDENLEKLGELNNARVTKLSNNYFIGTEVANNNDHFIYDDKGTKIIDLGFKSIIMSKGEQYFYGLNDEWSCYDIQGNLYQSNDKSILLAINLLNTKKVSLHGYGPFELGIPKQALIEKLGFELEATYLGEHCQTYDISNHFYNISLLFESSDMIPTLRRIYINEENIVTKSNVGINTTIHKLIQTYGKKIVSKQNHYVQNGKDYIYVPKDEKDQNYRINFYGYAGQIKHYSIGLIPQINYVEGCL